MPSPDGVTMELQWDERYRHGLVNGTERALTTEELSSGSSSLVVDQCAPATGSRLYLVEGGTGATIVERAEGPLIQWARYHRYTLTEHGAAILAAHRITVSTATASPNVGMPGGATQVRFLGYADPQSPAAPLPTAHLLAIGALEEVSLDAA